MVTLDLNDLLGRGYFPPNLPPPFITREFAAHVSNSAHLPAEFAGSQPSTRPIVHDVARPGRIPRRFSIPNPTAVYRAAALIVDNWAEIDGRLRGSPLTTSRPTPVQNGKCPLRWSHGWRERQLRSAEARAGARFVARADISLFYPSIYTHSIPWALHGKDVAKANHDQSLLGNALDAAVRLGQDRQTVGLPIGPDWSSVIAELILTAVDLALLDRCPQVRGYRLVDDYEFGCASEAEAERVLADLRATLAEFELRLNAEKTSIGAAPIQHIQPWRAELGSLSFRDSPAEQHEDLLACFDRAAYLASQFKTAAVMRFAINRLRHADLCGENWPLAQYLLLQAAVVEPACIRDAMKGLYAFWSRGFPVDHEALRLAICSLISRHAPQGNDGDVAWALWCALVFDVQLGPDVSAYVGGLRDPVVALVALDARERGLLDGLDVSAWQSLSTASDLHGEQWLLAYEPSIKGWIQGGRHIAAVPEFAFLQQGDVSFYDSSRWVEQREETKARVAAQVEGIEEIDMLDEDEWDLYPF